MEGRGTEHIKVVSQQTGTRNDEGSGPAPPRGGVGGEGQFCCEWPGVGSLAAGGVSSRTPISRNSPQPVCFGASLEPGRLCAGAPRGRRGPRPGAQACAETLGRPCLLENGRLHPPRGPHATPGTRGSAHAAGPSTLVPPGVLTPLSARRREARLRTAHSRAWPAPPPAGLPLRPVQPQPGPSRPPPPGPPLRSPKPGPPAPGLHTGPAHRPLSSAEHSSQISTWRAPWRKLGLGSNVTSRLRASVSPPANGAWPQPQGPEIWQLQGPEGCGPTVGCGQALPLCSLREPPPGQSSLPGLPAAPAKGRAPGALAGSAEGTGPGSPEVLLPWVHGPELLLNRSGQW